MFRESLVLVAVSFLLVFGFVKPVVADSFRIPSVSMVHTLEVGDRVLTSKLLYRLGSPERGDVVVFESVRAGEKPLVERVAGPAVCGVYPAAFDSCDEVLIKRVVGLPGDRISVREGFLYVNGERRREPYVNDRTRGRQAPFGPVTVPEGLVFVMGDNRGNSSDSRVYGPVPRGNLIGEAFVRFWPPGRIGAL